MSKKILKPIADPDDGLYARRAANQLPRLMEAAQAFLENKNKRLDLQCRHDLRAALAAAKAVK